MQCRVQQLRQFLALRRVVLCNLVLDETVELPRLVSNGIEKTRKGRKTGSMISRRKHRQNQARDILGKLFVVVEVCASLHDKPVHHELQHRRGWLQVTMLVLASNQS